MDQVNSADPHSSDLAVENIKCWKAEVAEGIEGHSGKILEAGKTGVVVAFIGR